MKADKPEKTSKSKPSGEVNKPDKTETITSSVASRLRSNNSKPCDEVKKLDDNEMSLTITEDCS